MLDPPVSVLGPTLTTSLTAMANTQAKSIFSKLTRHKGEALEAAIKGLEESKDLITAAAPVPGLSVVLDILIEVLKKIQVS